MAEARTAAAMNGEYVELAGVLVHARTHALDRVVRRIGLLPGAQVHATGPGGKLVVTLEAASGRDVLARLEQLRDIAGVLSASLVYEHTEPSHSEAGAES